MPANVEAYMTALWDHYMKYAEGCERNLRVEDFPTVESLCGGCNPSEYSRDESVAEARGRALEEGLVLKVFLSALKDEWGRHHNAELPAKKKEALAKKFSVTLLWDELCRDWEQGGQLNGTIHNYATWLAKTRFEAPAKPKKKSQPQEPHSSDVSHRTLIEQVADLLEGIAGGPKENEFRSTLTRECKDICDQATDPRKKKSIQEALFAILELMSPQAKVTEKKLAEKLGKTSKGSISNLLKDHALPIAKLTRKAWEENFPVQS